MSERIDEVTSELSRISSSAAERFGMLSQIQLNWKPSPKRWSVAQCFDHLITTHSLYLSLFAALRDGSGRETFWERHSPFSGLLGRMLIQSMRPENSRKMKTTSRAQPSTSTIDGAIIDRFVAHQSELIEHLNALPDDLDPVATTVTSPLAAVVTYSLDDCFTILVVHGQRHSQQAQRVTEEAGFPARA